MCDLDNLPFQLQPFFAHFFKPGCVDDSEFDSLLAAIFKDIRNKCVLDGDVHQVNLIRDLRYRSVGSEAFDELGFRVNRIYGTFEIVVKKVLHDNMADTQGIIRCADDGHRPRFK